MYIYLFEDALKRIILTVIERWEWKKNICSESVSCLDLDFEQHDISASQDYCKGSFTPKDY